MKSLFAILFTAALTAGLVVALDVPEAPAQSMLARPIDQDCLRRGEKDSECSVWQIEEIEVVG